MTTNPKFNLYKSEGPKPPCGRDCPDRKAGCAIDCEKWAAYVVERNKVYAARIAENDKNVNTAQRDRATGQKISRKKNNPGWF